MLQLVLPASFIVQAFGKFQESLNQALKLIGITLVEHKQNQLGAWFTNSDSVPFSVDKSRYQKT